MPRFLYLAGLLAAPAAFASDPVSAYPTAPTGSLSQPLTSVVTSAQYAAPAPPVMVSQPAWGAACPPAYGPVCPTPQPLIAPQMYRMPVPMPVSQPCATGYGYGYRGALLDRVRAWLCGGSGPALQPSRVWATPIRPWMPGHGRIVGEEGAAGWPSKCEGAGCQRFGLGARFGAAAACPTPAPVGPRPIRIPLPSATDCAPGAVSGECRPGLLRRILSFFSFRGSSMPSAYMPPMASGYQSAPGCAPGTSAMDGYHFAAPTVVPTQPIPVQSYPVSQTPTPNQLPVSMAPTVPTLSPAAAANQPFTRQR